MFIIYYCRVINPLTLGDYPDIMKKNVGSRLPSFTKEESNLIRNSIDFLGINFYNTFSVNNSPESLKMEDRTFMQDMAAEITSML